MTNCSTVEDALYCDTAVVTVAITNEWPHATDMLVLVKNNLSDIGEDLFDTPVTMREAAL